MRVLVPFAWCRSGGVRVNRKKRTVEKKKNYYYPGSMIQSHFFCVVSKLAEQNDLNEKVVRCSFFFFSAVLLSAMIHTHSATAALASTDTVNTAGSSFYC